MSDPLAAQTGELSLEDFAAGLQVEEPAAASSSYALSPEDFAAGIEDVYPKTPGIFRPLAGQTLESLAAVPEAAALTTKRVAGAKEARASVGVGKVGRPAPEEPTPPLQGFLQDWAGGLRGAAQQVYPQEVRGRGGLTEDVMGTVGGVVGSAPAMMLGPQAAALQFGAMEGVQLYHNVLASTKDEEAATWALLGGSLVGQFEKFGVEKALSGAVRRLASGPAGQQLVRKVTQRALGVGATAGAETGTELAQTGTSDLIFEALTDEDIDNIQNLKRALPPALIVGTALPTLFEVVDAGLQRGAQKKASQPAPGVPQAQEAQAEAPQPTDVAPAKPAPTGKTVAQVSEEARAEHPDYVRGVLAAVEPSGAPGLTSKPRDYGAGQVSAPGHEVVYRAPDGSPVAVGRVVERDGKLYVADFATDKSRGLLAGKAAVAVGREMQRLGAVEPNSTITDDAARLQRHASATPPALPQETTSPPEAVETPAEPASPTEAPIAPGEEAALAQPEDMDPEQLAPDQPPTTEAEPPKATSIKNKVVERELEEMGLPMPEGSARVSFAERHAKAKETFEKDRDSGSRLVTELEASPRPPTADEGALLAFEANRLINERDAAEAAFLKEPSEANQARIDEARKAYGRLADVLKRSGKESSTSLSIRKMMIARDYSLAAMERAFQVAKGGEDLTKAETARVKELHQKLAATTKAHEDYVSAAEAKRAELEAENAMLRLQKEAKGGARRSKRKAEIEQTKKELDEILNEIARVGAEARTGLDPKMVALTAKAAAKLVKLGVKSFAQFTDQMVARFGEGIRPYLQGAWDAGQGERRRDLGKALEGKETPEAIHRGVQEIALSFVEQGITERGALAKAVHEVVQEANPDMSLEDTRDAISGYGIFRKLTPGEARKTLRDLKGQMQQVAKLEALQQRLAPQKTGFERQEPSPTQKRLAKQVRDLQRQLGLTAKPDRLKTLKTRLQNQITDLQKRIAEKDFSDKPKPQPVTLDDEAIRLKAEKEQAAKLYEKERKEFERANWTWREKAIDKALEVFRFPRAFLSALDVSAPGRQGIFYALGHPIVTAKHTREMFRALASEKNAAEIDAKIQEVSEFGRAAGLDLAPLEEDAVSRWAQKIKGVRASNRAYSTFLNLQRVHHFNRLVAALPGTPTLADGKVIARAVNILTGRGAPPKKIAGALDALGVVLWSPRLLISRFQTVTGSPLRKGSRHVRKEMAKDYARFIAGAGALYTLVQLADELGDDEDDISVTFDGRSSDFGKIKIGPVRIDPLGGLSQVTVLLGRVITGEKKTVGGKVVPIRGKDVPYKGDNVLDLAQDFLRYKLSPVAAAVADIVTGEQVERDKSGKPLPTTPKSVARNLTVPISMRDVLEDVEDLGVPKTAALRLIGLFGLGVQNYGDSAVKTAKKD